MTRSNALLSVVWLAIGVCAALGCSSTTDPWRAHYQPAPDAPTAVAGSHPQLRNVTMSQVDAAVAATKRYLDSKKLALEDASPADFTEMRRLSLEEFRWRIDANTVRVLGSSWFDGPLSDGTSADALYRFGSSIGADFIVYAAAPAGTRTGTYSRPVVSTTTAQASAHAYDNRGNWARARGTGQSTTTTYVPTQYSYDVYQFIAFFYKNVPSWPAPASE